MSEQGGTAEFEGKAEGARKTDRTPPGQRTLHRATCATDLQMYTASRPLDKFSSFSLLLSRFSLQP